MCSSTGGQLPVRRRGDVPSRGAMTGHPVSTGQRGGSPNSPPPPGFTISPEIIDYPPPTSEHTSSHIELMQPFLNIFNSYRRYVFKKTRVRLVRAHQTDQQYNFYARRIHSIRCHAPAPNPDVNSGGQPGAQNWDSRVPFQLWPKMGGEGGPMPHAPGKPGGAVCFLKNCMYF